MPSEQQNSHMLIIEDDKGRREFNLDGPVYSIGRIVDGNLRGQGSANGLLVNGRKLQSHDLQNSDEVIFGPDVRAIYYLLKREQIQTVPPDEFDITLISPGMIGDPEDDDHLLDDDDEGGDTASG